MHLHVNLINYKTWLINQLIYHNGPICFLAYHKVRALGHYLGLRSLSCVLSQTGLDKARLIFIRDNLKFEGLWNFQGRVEVLGWLLCGRKM